MPQLAINLALLHSLARDGYTGTIAATAHNERDATELRNEGYKMILLPFADAAKEAIDELCKSGKPNHEANHAKQLQLVYDR